MDESFSFALQDWIEFREDSSNCGRVGDATLVSFENLDEILLRDELDLKSITGLLLIRPKDLERPAVVSGDEQVISIAMRKITF